MTAFLLIQDFHARINTKFNKLKLIKKRNKTEQDEAHIARLLIMQISFPTLGCEFAVVKCVQQLKVARVFPRYAMENT